MSLDLDALMAQVGGEPAPRQRQAQKRPEQQTQPRSSLDELMARHSAPQRQVRPRVSAGPPDVLWARLVSREAKEADPRPSRVVRAYMDSLGASQRLAVANKRGVWLQRARQALPRQPERPSQPRRLQRVSKAQATARVPTRGAGDPHRRLSVGVHPTIIDAFAGAGLLDLAWSVEGGFTVDLCENNRSAVETLAANRLLDFTPEPTDASTWEPVRIPGGVDVLTGGPPCKPFSKASQLGRDGRGLGPGAIDNFFPQVLDWICDLQPAVVCLENSSQIVEKADLRAWFEGWSRQAAVLGYETVFWNLSAASYGTPQLRKRAWVICFPKGASWGKALREPPPATHGRPGTPGVGPGGLLPWTRMFDRLVSGCCEGWYLVDCVNLGNNELRCRNCFEARNFTAAPNTTGRYSRVKMRGKKIGGRSFPDYMLAQASKKRKGQRRIEWRNPADMAGAWAWDKLESHARAVTRYLSRVVVPSFVRPPDGIMLPPGLDAFGSVDRTSDRSMKTMLQGFQVLSVRDAAKLQDVPQWYGFIGTRDACFTQIGMGVPVNLGRAVARHVLGALGYPIPDPAARPPDGLWPRERLDPCAAFVGLEQGVYSPQQLDLEWMDETDAGSLEITEQQRRARPYIAPQVYRPPTQQQRTARIQRGTEVARIFTESSYSDIQIDAEALWRSGWEPGSPTDVPRPFDELMWFAEHLRERSTDAASYNHFGLLYRDRFPASRFAEVWPLGRELGLPTWSPYATRDLSRAMRLDAR